MTRRRLNYLKDKVKYTQVWYYHNSNKLNLFYCIKCQFALAWALMRAFVIYWNDKDICGTFRSNQPWLQYELSSFEYSLSLFRSRNPLRYHLVFVSRFLSYGYEYVCTFILSHRRYSTFARAFSLSLSPVSLFTIFTSPSVVHPSEVNLGATTRSYYRVGWALIPIFQSTYRAHPTPHGLSKASRSLTRVKGKINKLAQKPGSLSLSLSLLSVFVLNALAYASIPIPVCLSSI